MTKSALLTSTAVALFLGLAPANAQMQQKEEKSAPSQTQQERTQQEKGSSQGTQAQESQGKASKESAGKKAEPKEKATKGSAQKDTEPKEKSTKGTAERSEPRTRQPRGMPSGQIGRLRVRRKSNLSRRIARVPLRAAGSPKTTPRRARLDARRHQATRQPGPNGLAQASVFSSLRRSAPTSIRRS